MPQRRGESVTMKADLQVAIRNLKTAVGEEGDFAKLFGIFFDLSLKPGFLGHAHRVEKELLLQVLRHAGGAALGTKVRRFEALTVQVVGTDLVHGGGSIDGRTLAFFYFEDLGKGIMTLYPGLKPGETLFTRIAAVALPAHANVVIPPKSEPH